MRQVILAGGAGDARAQEAAVAPLTAVATGGAGGDARLQCEPIFQSNIFGMHKWTIRKEAGSGRGRGPPLPEVWPGPAHLSLVGEASQETLPLTPVQDLQLFVVDAVLLPDILSRVQRRTFLVHAKLSAATAALGG